MHQRGARPLPLHRRTSRGCRAATARGHPGRRRAAGAPRCRRARPRAAPPRARRHGARAASCRAARASRPRPWGSPARGSPCRAAGRPGVRRRVRRVDRARPPRRDRCRRPRVRVGAARPRPTCRRAATSASGAARSHASGMRRATIPGAKLKNASVTTSGPTAPRGAARKAKYPIQNPRSPHESARRTRLRGEVRDGVDRLQPHPDLPCRHHAPTVFASRSVDDANRPSAGGTSIREDHRARSGAAGCRRARAPTRRLHRRRGADHCRARWGRP